MLISDAYREQNRLLHEQSARYGTSGRRWAPYVQRLVEEEGYSTILDYGAGKQTLAKALPNLPIVSYDPCVPGLDAKPEPADLVVCTDVLEHIERKYINAVIRDLKRVTRRKLLFNIALCPSTQTLSDGRNAHLLVKDGEWWLGRLRREFHVITYDDRPGRMLSGEAVPRGLLRIEECPATRRRPLTPEVLATFDSIRNQINRYSDPITRVETVRMWENVDDEVADVQIVANILEYLPDVERALFDIAQYALKAVVFNIKLDDVRGEPYWRYVIGRRYRIASFQVFEGHAQIFAAPSVGVQGVHVVGAVDGEKRWQQVMAAIARCPKRIEAAPAHERRAIIACYGPSLGATLELLKRERAETGAAVVSVSGAHDFLLRHGIVPDYHVECDPRAHKADNISRPHPDVTYLLASCVHPVLFDKLGPDADVRLWHISSDDHTGRLIDEMGENPAHIISGGGSVGLRSMPLFYAMGYRRFSVYAMDCSYSASGEKWAGRHFGQKEDACEIECAGRTFISSPVLVSYATNFWEQTQKVTDMEIRLFGDGLLQWWARNLGFEPKMLGPSECAA